MSDLRPSPPKPPCTHVGCRNIQTAGKPPVAGPPESGAAIQQAPPIVRAGQLATKVTRWEAIGCSTVVLRWLTQGFPLPGAQRVTRRACAAQWEKCRRHDAPEEVWGELERLAMNGVVVQHTSTEPLVLREEVFLSPLFARPKPNGKIRIIFNLRRLNKWLDIPPHFKMQDLTVLRDTLRQGDFLAKVDLADAYFHIPIRKDHQRLLAFRWKGQVWMYTVLPFGLAWSPWVFTKVLRVPQNVLTGHGLRLIFYLDDGLLMAPSLQTARTQLAQVLDLFADLGLQVNPAKSSLQPVQILTYLWWW